MNNHLTTYSQSVELKKIGVPQKSSFVWSKGMGFPKLKPTKEFMNEFFILHSDLETADFKTLYSAFTLSELIEVLGEAKIYPLQIVKDRYGGAYSKGKWLAIADSEAIYDGSYEAGDVDCMDFWDKDWRIGVGQAPIESTVNLILKLHKEGLIFNDKANG